MTDLALFTHAQQCALQALVDCIIPADDYPSGWQAGVGDYLARQFTRDLAQRVDAYRQGLDALDAEAIAGFGHPFATLSSVTQTNLLTQIEAGAVRAVWSIDPSAFFKMAIEHTQEGYYSDPGNGGNHNSISWQMIGYQVTG